MSFMDYLYFITNLISKKCLMDNELGYLNLKKKS